MGKIPIVAANNLHFTHNVLMHQKNKNGCLLLPLLLSLISVSDFRCEVIHYLCIEVLFDV
jgi:hypothetical protein